jgi:hypothetical protein
VDLGFLNETLTGENDAIPGKNGQFIDNAKGVALVMAPHVS